MEIKRQNRVMRNERLEKVNGIGYTGDGDRDSRWVRAE